MMSAGHQILQYVSKNMCTLQLFCADNGMEHGGRGFRAGRTRLSAARMANFQGNRTGEYHMRRPTTSKLFFADPCVPILCVFSAPGESLDRTKELSIKFDAKEDAEITQVDAAA